jgi:hypothetical protein
MYPNPWLSTCFCPISHQYLFHFLHRYGVSEVFIEIIRALYDNATTAVQISGYLVGTIHLHSAVRQGCPPSMVLYALCLHPLLRTIEGKLQVIQINRQKWSVPAVAYADDVTIFVTRLDEFIQIKKAIHTYERANSARLNVHKSKTMTIGNWVQPPTILGIDLHPQLTILGSPLHLQSHTPHKPAGRVHYTRCDSKSESHMTEPSVSHSESSMYKSAYSRK